MAIDMAAGKSDGLRGKLSLLRSAIASCLQPARRWYQNSALRLLFVEIRVLGPRMAKTLQIRKVEQYRGLGIEEVHEWMGECLVGAPCRQDYIPYMRQTVARMPLTIFDSLLATHAWKAGWESRDRSCRSQSLVDRSLVPKYSPASEDDSNSAPGL